MKTTIWISAIAAALSLTACGGAVEIPTEGKVALVLAAGNVPSIGSLDTIHKLFFEDQVVLLKFNPVNEYVAPFQEEVFEEFIRDGFLRTAYGGGEVGAYLCQHDGIDEVHITGSNITHDIIVYGPNERTLRRGGRDLLDSGTVLLDL
ncbi:MAG: hypothetical protein IIB14_03040 [Chloroflexi bacterium]|nr:hypothetical protein [Chloroflexota bacterium]